LWGDGIATAVLGLPRIGMATLPNMTVRSFARKSICFTIFGCSLV